jgi:hypothetical protein
MKLSLALGPRQPLSRQMAMGCLSTNLAMPGFGTLLAGRVVGYFQILFYTIAFALTMLGGIPTLIWFGKNWSHFKDLQETDPGAYMSELWVHMRWPLLGIALFFFALFWALASSLAIIAEAKAAEKNNLPPRLPPKL